MFKHVRQKAIMTRIDRFDGEYFFLSNFYPADVSYSGVDYPTIEHAFQAAKTLDPEERSLVFKSGSPGAAKRLGRKVKMRGDWDSIKFGIMEELIRQKFTRYPDLRQLLLDTGDVEIIEGNTWGDRLWGMTIDKSGQYVGQNHLGKILMKVREELRAEDKI
jgi:ribA/ribD-fused uncharacterized protein